MDIKELDYRIDEVILSEIDFYKDAISEKGMSFLKEAHTILLNELKEKYLDKGSEVPNIHDYLRENYGNRYFE